MRPDSLPRSLVAVAVGLLLTHADARPASAQSVPPAARTADARALTVLDGVVLGPGGEPAAGAVLVSSSGGQTSTRLDGAYRLEVRVLPGATSLTVTAVASKGRKSLTASATVSLPAVAGVIHVAPLLLAPSPTCPPRWVPTFGIAPGFKEGTVYALAVYDDGSGPALYAGGRFYRDDPVSISSIGKWDGERWSPVGSGVNQTVNALTVFDDGSGPALYAGGFF